MPFFLPNFNLLAAVWHDPRHPPDVADFTTDAQLYVASRGLIDIQPEDFIRWQPPIYLRVPKGTDLKRHDSVKIVKVNGIPVVDPYIYTVRWVERLHLGFPNEYLVGVVEQRTSPFPPAPIGAVLLEIDVADTEYVLTETGDYVQTE